MPLQETILTPMAVAFDELDAGGVVYHGYYLRYCDRARNEIYGAWGCSFADLLADGYALPLVSCNNTFRRPLRMQKILVATRFIKASRRSLTVRHAIYGESVEQAAILAAGDDVQSVQGCYFSAETVLVSVSLAAERAVALPPRLKQAFRLP